MEDNNEFSEWKWRVFNWQDDSSNMVFNTFTAAINYYMERCFNAPNLSWALYEREYNQEGETEECIEDWKEEKENEAG